MQILAERMHRRNIGTYLFQLQGCATCYLVTLKGITGNSGVNNLVYFIGPLRIGTSLRLGRRCRLFAASLPSSSSSPYPSGRPRRRQTMAPMRCIGWPPPSRGEAVAALSLEESAAPAFAAAAASRVADVAGNVTVAAGESDLVRSDPVSAYFGGKSAVTKRRYVRNFTCNRVVLHAIW